MILPCRRTKFVKRFYMITHNKQSYAARLIWLRNIPYFYLASMIVATSYIVPQFFFLQFFPENKDGYLMALLVVGTIFSIWGVNLAEVFSLQIIKPQKWLAVILTICGLLSYILFQSSSLVLFLGVFIFAKFLLNFCLHFMDGYFVRITDSNAISTHASSHSIYTLLGTVCASLYLGYWFEFKQLNSWLFLGLGLFCAVNALQSITKHDVIEPANSVVGRLATYQKYYLSYGITIFSAYGVFSSILIYLLHDYYQFPNPRSLGGLILALSCIAGALAIVVLNVNRGGRNADLFGGKIVPWLVVINSCAILLFLLKPIESPFFVVLLSVVTGATYGIFLSLNRTLVSKLSQAQSQRRFLFLYNNLPNYSALLGFALCSGIMLICSRIGVEPYSIILLMITLLFPIGLYCWCRSRLTFFDQAAELQSPQDTHLKSLDLAQSQVNS